MSANNAIIEAAAPECEHDWWDAGEHNPGHEQCSRCWEFRPLQSYPIIKAAARALRERWLWLTKSDPETTYPEARPWEWLAEAEAVVTTVTPLIRAAALEEAAQMVEGLGGIDDEEWAVIAQDIRALITPKEQHKEKP